MIHERFVSWQVEYPVHSYLCPVMLPRLTQILEALHKDYQRTRIVRHGATFSVLAAGGGLAGSSVYFGAPLEMAVGVAATTLVAVGSVQVLRVGHQ